MLLLKVRVFTSPVSFDNAYNDAMMIRVVV